MAETTTCSHCARIPSPSRPVELWAVDIRDGHRQYACDPCARESLWEIELRLDA